MPRDPDHRPGGSPRKRERAAARARGESVAGESRHGRDRTTKLTPEVHERILTFVKAGNFLDTAAAAGGVLRATMRGWIERGAREQARRDEGHEPDLEEEPYVTFMRDVTTSQAEAEAYDVAAIGRAGRDYESTLVAYDAAGKVAKTVRKTERGDFRALTWRLEHMHGEKYTTRIKLEVEGQLDGMLDYLEQNIPPESYRHVVEALAKRFGAAPA
jgi:hypothetical protein